MSIKKSISFTFGAQIINTCIGFLASIIITRILGAEGRGEQTIFMTSNAFAVLFFGFSINSTIPYFINSGKAKAGELLTTIIIFILSSTVLVFFTLFFLEYWGKIGWAIPNSIQSLQYKLIFTGIFFTSLLNGVLSTYLTSYKKFKEISIYGILLQILPLIVYLLLYYNILPYDRVNPFKSIVIATTVLSFVSIIAIIILFVRTLPVRPAKKIIGFNLIKQFVFFTSLVYIGNVVQFLSYKLDYWFVDAYRGKSTLGIYSLAVQLSQLLWILPQAISSVLYSHASSCTQDEALRLTLILKKIGFYSSLIFSAGGLALSYFFIPILFGKEFAPATSLMFIFVIGIIPFSIPIISASFFAARGFFKFSFYIGLIVSAVTILLYIILIPRYGVTGAAIASAFSYFISTILCEYVMYKKYCISPFETFKINKEYFIKAKYFIKTSFIKKT